MSMMSLPQFQVPTPTTSDPLSSRISRAMGVDYSVYLSCRQTDKNMPGLIGTSINRAANNPVEWGRPVSDNAITDRPPVDRSSGLYSSRRSAMGREQTPVVNNKTPTPAANKSTPKSGANNAEEVLRNDLYLTSSDDEGPDGHPDAKEAKLSHRAGGPRRAEASGGSEPKSVKDLTYWIRTAKMKAPSASNSDGAGSPDGQKSSREVDVKKEEEEAVTPKSSSYRELVKNGLDSLAGQRPARRAMRMLSGLPDSDDEAPVIVEKPSKRAKHSGEFRHNTPLSPVSNTFDWKRRKSRSPRPRHHASKNKGFVERKISRSPQRELVPYNDLDDDASDSSMEADPVKEEPVEEPKFSASPVPPKRRKYEKVCEETIKPQVAVKASSSPNRQQSRHVKTERIKRERNERPEREHHLVQPKREVVDRDFHVPMQQQQQQPPKREVFDKDLHGFRRDPVHKFMVHFKVPPFTAPSHRKRKRRENVSPMKVESSVKESSSNGDAEPRTHCPVQSSSQHSNSDSDSQHRLAQTGGFHVSANVDSDPFEVSSPDTDPMVDPTFDRNLSDVESDYEISSQRHIKKSPEHRSHSTHRHRPSMPQSATPMKGGSRVSSSLDHSADNDGENSAALRASVNTFEHKLGHTNGTASNLVGQSLPVDSKRETNCKKSPESRSMARPSSPTSRGGGDRVQPSMMQIKTSPAHESATIKSEPGADSLLKPKPPFSEPLYKSMPKIPRKRPPGAGRDELPESKKKKKQSSQEQLPPNPEEPVIIRETTKIKMEKEGSKKSKDRPKIKRERMKVEPTDSIKREPSTPPTSNGRFEVSVSDSTLAERSFSPSPADNAAPFLPPATAASAAVTEIGTQCELLPIAERDFTESGTHTKRMAVAFRIEGGRGSTPIVSGEARTQSQTPRSSGQTLQTSLAMEIQTSGGGGVPRRRSSASVDDGESAQNAGGESANDQRDGPPRADPNESLMDAVIRHRNQQERVIQNENIAYQRMNSTQCFSEAAAKKHEADRLKNEEPARFALHALRACYLFIQACYVEERQGKLDNAAMHYRETVHYVRSTAQMIEQVTKVPSNSELLGSQRARVRHNFITLLCTEMKAMLNYRVYFLHHRDTARLRQEVERELNRCGAGSGANGASERSTPESLTRSPATSCGGGSSSSGGLHLMGEAHHKLLRYLMHTKSLTASQEYWQHAQLLRTKHGADLRRIEEKVFRRARHEFTGPDTPVPSFLRYLNTFLTLHEQGEL